MSLPVVNQYSVFDEVQDVVKVRQVSDVDDLPSVEEHKEASDNGPSLKRAVREPRPDEVDVIVKAAAEASCRHLIQPQNWLVWICNPAREKRSVH